MNIYQKVYLQELITQENVKSLIPNIQNQLLNYIGVDNYKDLLPNDKIRFQEQLNNSLKDIKQKVDSLTNNLQYQSWVYKILKQKDKQIFEDYNVIKSALIDFKNLCKRSDLTSQQRNINNYQTFQDLQKFILSFQNEHKLEKNIYKNLKKLYNNNTYTCYLVNNYDECHKLFGGQVYFNTGWCVAKSSYYFNYYLNTENFVNQYTTQYNGYIVFIENKTNKPYALLHYDSYQFKDTSDAPIKNYDIEIIDCLNNLQSNFKAYIFISAQRENDLENFAYEIFKINNKNTTYITFFALIHNMQCNENQKIFNCKNQKLIINELLIANNIFNYKIINCSALLINQNIQYLPDNFYIPQSINDCDHMFYFCTKLKKLPENFTIPMHVISCNYMFSYCKNLQKLPQNFSIPDNLDCFYQMFAHTSFSRIPQKLYKSLKAKKLSDEYILRHIFPYSTISQLGRLR